MTGEPAYTFRETDELPECRQCGAEMAFEGHEEEPTGERDLYACPDCGAELEDRWTF